MYFLNPRVAREGCRGVFSGDEYAAVAAFFARRRDIRPTPLYRLPALARRLGLRALLVKDESQRMGLNAFKGAGAAYAIDRLMAGRPEHDRPVLVCASAGNHGRAVAHAGAQRGLEVIVYMSATTAAGPRLAIEAEGARVALVDGTYDDAVKRATVDAAASGALIVSDTAWPGYEAVPHDIMAGYTHIFEEARAEWDEAPDLAIVQAGVGSFAAAAAAWWSDRYGVERPCFVCCEPLGADPLLQSARAGHAVTSTRPAAARSKAAPAVAEGNHRPTIMSGLRCSEASSIAVPILLRAADVFVSIDDELTRDAMRLLARPRDGDPAIVAGPSGAAGLGALLAIRDRERHRHARVLLVNTEGATDRALYDDVLASP
jgi:diaminopropionate ammonia-lyase